MASTAFQTIYRQEFIAGFEQNQSYLRDMVTTEANIKGNTAYFLVADSGDATAVTRGTNGLIPARADDLTQTAATLVESHDLVKKTGFNVESSQGDQRRIMQQTSMATINRKLDSTILTALSAGTQFVGTSATTASLELVMHGLSILGNGAVPLDGNINAVVSPAFHAYLMQTKEFASADYINNKPFTNNLTMYRWAGVNFVVHPNISGKGTALEYCYLWHKSAIGHAINKVGIQAVAGYDDEQDYSYARTSVFEGAALLQNSGVVGIRHDGSAFAATA